MKNHGKAKFQILTLGYWHTYKTTDFEEKKKKSFHKGLISF